MGLYRLLYKIIDVNAAVPDVRHLIVTGAIPIITFSFHNGFPFAFPVKQASTFGFILQRCSSCKKPRRKRNLVAAIFA